MYLFELMSLEPLEPHGDLRYKTLLSNCGAVLFLEQSGAKAIECASQMSFLCEHDMPREFTGICYDRAEQCYWGCSAKHNDIIYKLSDTFREVDRFQFCEYDSCDGSARAISYDSEDDCLILTYANRVLAVDKRSMCVKTVLHCDCTKIFQSCIRSGAHHYFIWRNCGTDTLTIHKSGNAIIHCCLPPCHRFLGMAETCDEYGPVISLLSVKHGRYHYILQGLLVERQQKRTGCCTDSREEGGATRPQKDCDCPHTRPACDHGYEDPPYLCRGGRVGCCGCGSYSNGHQLPGWETIPGGCASIMESIALEQTALSHILNAEGEKIQKIIAVSDNPEDFLSVNRSVLEMVTKVTHLEQVLLGKLELACGALRDTGV